jgi:hypothetical protein
MPNYLTSFAMHWINWGINSHAAGLASYPAELAAGPAILRSTSLQAHRYSGPHSQRSRSCEFATIFCTASWFSKTHFQLIE